MYSVACICLSVCQFVCKITRNVIDKFLGNVDYSIRNTCLSFGDPGDYLDPLIFQNILPLHSKAILEMLGL